MIRSLAAAGVISSQAVPAKTGSQAVAAMTASGLVTATTAAISWKVKQATMLSAAGQAVIS